MSDRCRGDAHGMLSRIERESLFSHREAHQRKPLVSRFLPFLSCLFIVGCGGTTGDGSDQYLTAAAPLPQEDRFDRYLRTLADPNAPAEDIAEIAALSDADEQLLVDRIEGRGIVFLPGGGCEIGQTDALGKGLGCPWDGTTRWDQALTRANNYMRDGHHAIYFRVDANAGCYDKSLDWWVSQCCPTHGCVSSWQLQISRDRYYDSNLRKYVKDVVLLVPSSWWIQVWWWPDDWKASRFFLSWNDTRQSGCCE